MSGRFDADEALRFILKVLASCGEKKVDEPNDGSVNLPCGDADCIRNQVYAVRAYLAGRMDAAPQDAVQEHGKCGCCGVDMAFHVYLDEQVNRHLMKRSLADETQRRHHHKGCTVPQALEPVFPGASAPPLTPNAIAAFKQEAENVPDMPGVADWGRKAVLRLIVSHEVLRHALESIPYYPQRQTPYYARLEPFFRVHGIRHGPWEFCRVCGVLMDYENLNRQVERGERTRAQAIEVEARHHKPGCIYGTTPFSHWFDPYPPRQVRYVPRASDGMLTVGPFEPGSTVEIKVR